MQAVATATRELPSGETGSLSFPPFRLDLAQERLWKGEVELRLRRKPFAILRYLALHPRQLVTHSELVQAVWGANIAMSESLLRTHVRDLRSVLGEEIIETVVGRGYRFTPARTLRLVGCPPPAERPTPSAAHARILEEVAGALAALGPNATVLMIVAGAASPDGEGG